jgi:YYY domain-containing protein
LPGALYLAGEVASRLSITREVGQLLVAAGLLATVVAYLAGNAVYVVLLAYAGAALACTYATDDSERRAAMLLLLAASLALLACELVFIKDAYGDKLYRMNTVFKLYFQSWILLSIAAPWCWAALAERLQRQPSATHTAELVAVSALFLISCAYPVGITATRLSGRGAPSTLDGTAYLEREHPDDFAVVKWMRENISDLPVVLEATGNPYSYYARVSSNTGLPTVLGWANHEGLWRSHENEVGQRSTEVTRMYNAPTLAEVAPLLDRYHVQYIVVGELERKDYQTAGLAKFSELAVAFSQGGTTLYRR